MNSPLVKKAAEAVQFNIQIEVTGEPARKYYIIDGLTRMNAARYLKETEHERNKRLYPTPHWTRVLGRPR